MGNYPTRSDLESATVQQIGEYVANIGPEYKAYEISINDSGFTGDYLIFKIDAIDSLFSLLCITNLAHIDYLKYLLTTVYNKKANNSKSVFATPGSDRNLLVDSSTKSDISVNSIISTISTSSIKAKTNQSKQKLVPKPSTTLNTFFGKPIAGTTIITDDF